MIELTHLRIVAALQQHGTLTKAANALCLSQSALSHQIRYLEQKLGVEIWVKEGRRLRLTRAGNLLLETAEKVLPVLQQSQRTLKAYADGQTGVLRLGVECYPCYEWLTGVTAAYLKSNPQVDVDIFQRFRFSGFEGVLNFHIDMLITPDRVDHPGLSYQPLFGYELMLLVPESHPLAEKDWVSPQQLASEVLITFPVAEERLDVLNSFLWPAGVRPQQHKQIESIEIMLQLVAFSRGVTVIPDWLIERACQALPLKSLRLGRQGMQRKLYAAYRTEDQQLSYQQAFISVAGSLSHRGV
ncbi:MAG: LysR family transcriptional regulator [Candidatus Thiodiazotropha taylori]|uniref:LysR family transcriptional regulator n=1 Tax=Candidatus Thiodiazotropha taylori TaxID=2792791 RepID=A0A9E4N4W8_9GAMM|nr:LysR family transcriptional regulator [Candidatus Thiodiazotropha taylori]MCG7957403.1 LysR family transcriptional regulator [Candidatus Thiodiazotropha taylori]MCG8040232.1 LysR family transcriptional regulator [Candidatus Thiodiazotropha taylori]MCG8056337.1 LysR family transcriptional regulator [Candidatus Thiodiazotropha taylori]MCW4242769.1 LysR family transcriptional regulator [Candidatus Thiodiazotropha taylori]